ncbi:MAG TPA: TIGR03435 family protein [Vicinamibacterales bacterium]|nr:TIGR03435 family protein [Vicinamibacterales bacterium]
MISALLGASVAAQQPKPRFEVASVTPAESLKPLRAPVPRVQPGGRFSAGLATVEALMSFAYDLKPYRIAGGPDWVRRDRFEVSAKAETDAPADQIRLMVQSLLEDRFNLVTHIEQREMPFQALVRARSDGSLGTIRSQFTLVTALFGVYNNDPNLPALSTALQEQPGLKLEPRRGPVDVLVIDSAQHPAEN